MASSSSSSSLSIFLPLTLLLLISPALSLTCTSQTFANNKLYSKCADLPVLSSFLHWTYDPANSTLSIAFISPPSKSDGWIAWAINPTSTGMPGSQTLLAYKKADGSMAVKTFNISSYKDILESKLSFDVWDTAAESSGGVFRLFAKLKVEKETVNQVWQVGPSVSDGFPAKHDFLTPNLNSKGTLSLTGGTTTTTASGGSKMKKRNIHGILNAVSWGLMFPIGIIVSGYAIGVAGWATGIKLGSESKGVVYTNHRNIGIVLFALATLQIFALFLRPKKEHKFRFYWNIYHHTLGYTILVLGIINVFKGLDILNPAKHWRSTYIIVIITLGALALLLEAITWIVVLKRKSRKATKPYDGLNNGQG
ncbi:hypothetical protein ACFX1Q_035362 [Malus domestica]